MTSSNNEQECFDNFLKDFPEQVEARNFLWQSYLSYRIGSAYLFTGLDGIGKFVAAIEYIKFLKCTRKECGQPCGKCNTCRTISAWDNTDIFIIFPMPSPVWKKTEQMIEAYENFKKSPFMRPGFSRPTRILLPMIHTAQQFLSTPASSPGGKFVIVADAHRMNKESANAFLKTLEEPPPDSHIILSTSHPESLLPTIRSRTQPVRFRRVSTKQIYQHLFEKHNITKELAECAAQLAEGSVATALKLASTEFIKIRESAIETFHYAADENILKIWEWANEAPSNSEYAFTFLQTLISLARDTAACISGSKILNIDSQEIIEHAASKLRNTHRALQLIRRINQLRANLERNPQYSLLYGAIASVITKSFKS